jgi:predicted outer membrane repeat protein
VVKRLIALFVLLSALTGIVNAQAAKPPRGAYSPETPYAVPGGIQTRDTVYVVNTTSDDDYQNGNTCDPDAGAGLTLREAIEDCSAGGAATIYVPAGIYFLQDDLDSNYDDVTIIGENPLTTIIDNSRDDVIRAAGHGFSLTLAAGQSAMIANLTFRDSDATFSNTNLGGGGLLVLGTGGSLTLHNLIFDSNSGARGGAIAVEGELDLSITNATFKDNAATAGSGGALYFSGTGPGSDISISDSVFIGNTATNAGGALYFWEISNVLFSDVTIMKNEAGGAGGGIFLDFARASFVNTEITLNSASHAGGISSADTAYLYNTVIENNIETPDDGTSDCYIDVANFFSLGNNAIGNLLYCDVQLQPSDVYNNLLYNGGFEQFSSTSKLPAGWAVRAPGAVRTCNKTGKSASGVCALKLTAFARVQQTVDLTDLTFSASDVLKLFAEGLGNAASKASVKVIVSYGDGTPKDTDKITFNGAGPTAGFDSADNLLALSSGNVSKIVVKIANSAGTLYLDRVYVFVDLSGVPRGVLPVPAAPALRGSN